MHARDDIYCWKLTAGLLSVSCGEKKDEEEELIFFSPVIIGQVSGILMLIGVLT